MKRYNMDRGKRLAALLLTLSMGVGLTACGNTTEPSCSSESPSGTGGTGSNDTYVISVNTALSGSGGGYGEASRRGAELAIQEINEAGGINGVMLSAVYDDNKQQPAEATAIARRRFGEGVVASTVGVTGTTALAVMPLAEESQIPLIPIGLATTAITTSGNNYVYRLYINDGAAAASVASYLVNELGLSKIAVIHDQNDYGIGGKDIVVSTLNNMGIEPVAVESFNSGDVDFSAQLIKVREAGADALILWGMGSEMALLASQARELGLDVQLAGGGAMDNTAAYVDVAGEASNGTIFATWMIPEDTQERYDAFVTAFQEAYNDDPESESILAYDAIYIIAEGLKAAGGDKAKLNDALKELTYTGLYGTYSFTDSGDNTIPVSIVQWQGSKRVLLEEIDPTPFYE